MRWFLLFIALALPSSAQEAPMTGAEFEAYTTGKTLSYATEGSAPYGAEEYLPDRGVRWAFTGQECKEGEWFEAGELICFVYEDDPGDAQCWWFYLTPRGLRAQFANRESAPLYVIDESPEPLFCPGPQIGV